MDGENEGDVLTKKAKVDEKALDAQTREICELVAPFFESDLDEIVKNAGRAIAEKINQYHAKDEFMPWAKQVVEEWLIPQLINNIESGDAQTFDTLFELEIFQSRIIKTCQFLARRNGSSLDEVMSDAYIKMRRCIKTYAGEAKFETWFSKVLKNLFIDRCRREAIEKKHLNDLERFSRHGYPTENAVEKKEINRLSVKEALDSLPKEDRKIINLGQEGYSVKEIAQELGLTPDAVYTRRAKISRRLAEWFKK